MKLCKFKGTNSYIYGKKIQFGEALMINGKVVYDGDDSESKQVGMVGLWPLNWLEPINVHNLPFIIQLKIFNNL